MKAPQLAVITALSAIGMATQVAHAQTWPSKPIHIHTTGAGGGSDFAARTVAAEFTTVFGQQAVVENKQGGLSLPLGVARSAPDGYTLLVNGGSLWTGPLFEDAPYDVLRDFAPISTLTTSPNILIIYAPMPARTVPELIKLLKANPGKYNWSSGPTGSSSHIAAELFKSLAGVDAVSVKYPQQPKQVLDSLSGEVHITFNQGGTWMSQVKQGKLAAIATGGAKRSAEFPDLPTVASTLPGFVSESLLTLWAPAKTPDAVLKRLNLETVKLLQKPDVKDRLLKNGQEALGSTPEQLLDYAKGEIATVTKLVNQAKLKPS